MWARRDLKSPPDHLLPARALDLTLVVLATCAGGYLRAGRLPPEQHAVGGRDPDVGVPRPPRARSTSTCRWWTGARASRRSSAPIRLRVDLQTVDRERGDGARRGPVARHRARCARRRTRRSRPTCMRLIALTVARGARARPAGRVRHPQPGPAPALDGGRGDRRRRSGSASRWSCCIPPRGEIANPQYYAHGPDIPRALEAVEAARRTTGVLDQELDAQLVGLARLVIDPGRRQSLAGQPVITVASDLHNNTFGIGVLQRVADDGPVFFVGDLTDRGSPLETQPRRARPRTCGKPFVFVSGNHDSDYLARELAKDGAIVLTRTRPAEAGRQPRADHQQDRGPARRGLRRPVRAPERRLVQATATTTRRNPAMQDDVPAVADAADRQGRRGDGPRARR